MHPEYMDAETMRRNTHFDQVFTLAKKKMIRKAQEGQAHCWVRCDKPTATRLRSQGYKVFRVPFVALILW